MQGEVREKFEEEKIKSDEFLRGYYPAAINPAPYRETVQRELNRIFSYLTEKFALDEMESNLGKFTIIDLEKVSAERFLDDFIKGVPFKIQFGYEEAI